MGAYGQFSPLALAAEVFARKWTPLVVHELLCGSVRFNDLRRGLPRMSPALLVKRLEELRRAGVLERTGDDDHPEYHLTEAGRALGPVVEALGAWGRRWGGRLREDDLDADVLMWDVRRRIDADRVPREPTTVHFVFEDLPPGRADYWVVVGRDEVDLRVQDPGRRDDLVVRTDVRTMTEVWIGDARFSEAVRRGDVRLKGPEDLRSSFSGWLELGRFADVPRRVDGAGV